VFVPTPPNPTTGPLLFLPEEELVPTTITVEQAIRMVVSAGVATPPAPGAQAPDAVPLGPSADFPE
jgi:uncharacterized membrane protein